MRKIAALLAFATLLFARAAFATCSVTVPAATIQIVDCTQGSIVSNSPFYSLTDATGLQLAYWMGWTNPSTSLLSGVPVTGTATFTNGNPVISWPAHGLTAGSYIVLSNASPLTSVSGTLPSNFTASTFSAQTVYFVIATGLTANQIELSATGGGAAITPNASGSAFAINLIAAFSAASNVVFNGWKTSQQATATAAPVPPSQIAITPGQ